ncbi:MAG: hypothetical protein GYA21_18045 [Myxococcales bacterium]|nr:hypothetical protein [Myxococcales bacterium]
MPSRCWGFLLAAGFASLEAGAAELGPARFALVIGHNRSDRAEQPPLLFADDDAIRMARTLRQAGVETVLLCDPDADTRSRFPEAAPAGRPEKAALLSAFGGLRSAMTDQVAAGRRVEFFFFFSGHGEVERGEGYLVLADGRLSRGELSRLLSSSPASFNHVILDACRSYYLVFGRGPGGERTPMPAGFARAWYPGASERSGFLLSTSSDRESHEWERYRSGVFTHLLISALRGAADADCDGRLLYAEVGAFLENAVAGIPQTDLRPRFFIRPPGIFPGDMDHALLSWIPRSSDLLLDAPTGAVYLEDARGVRLCDAHPSAGSPLALFLPPGKVFVRAPAQGREWAIERPGARLSALPARPLERLGEKGALHEALRHLMRQPFGAGEVTDFRRQFARAAQLAENLAAFLPPAEPPPPAPAEPCARTGEYRCRGEVRERCGLDPAKTLAWQSDTDCAAQGMLCRDGACAAPGFGGKLAFVGGAPGNEEVWVMNDDGGGRRRLTQWAEKPKPYWGAFDPRWSPDGSRLAFIYGIDDSLPEQPKSSRLCLVDADGSGFREITRRHSLQSGSLSWRGPDALLVTTTNLTWNARLLQVNIADGKSRVLLEDSPDGFPNPNGPEAHPTNENLLLYLPYRCGGQNGGLRLLNLQDGGERVLVFPDSNLLGARWSLDGGEVGWPDGHAPRIHRANADGQTLESVRPAGLSDDNWIESFDYAEGGFVFLARTGADRWIWVCDRDGQNARPVLQAKMPVSALDWAPGRLNPFSKTACAAAGGRFDSDTRGGFGCWFAARENQSCHDACDQHGLSCPASDWNDFPNSTICGELTREKPAGVNNPDWSGMAPYLYIPSGTSHGCYVRAPTVRQDCSARSLDRVRLCLCRPFEGPAD